MCLFHCNYLLLSFLAPAFILVPHSLSVLLDLCPCCVLSKVALSIPLLTSLFTLPIPSCSWFQPCTLLFPCLLLSLFIPTTSCWLGSLFLSAQAAHIPVLPWRPACIRGHGDSMGFHNPLDERGRNTATMKNDEKQERENERESGNERELQGKREIDSKSCGTIFKVSIYKDAALWYTGKTKFRYVSFRKKVCVYVVCRKAALHIAFSDHNIWDFKPEPMP